MEKPSRVRRRRWPAILATIVAALIALVFWNKLSSDRFSRQLTQDRSDRIATQSDPSRAPAADSQRQPADPDARSRSLIVGNWADEFKGTKRIMTINNDGTGTMVVELSGLQAIMASRLRFNLKWSLKDGHFKEQTVGGEPAAQVKLITSTMGDHVDQTILELTDARLLLLDSDGKTQCDWKRVKI
jgi:hypothetical protein